MSFLSCSSFLGRGDSHEKTNFYRLYQNKLVILQKTKSCGMKSLYIKNYKNFK